MMTTGRRRRRSTFLKTAVPLTQKQQDTKKNIADASQPAAGVQEELENADLDNKSVPSDTGAAEAVGLIVHTHQQVVSN